MINFDNISKELDYWVKLGLFTEVSYYLGNFSNTRLILSIWDFQKTTVEFDFNENHKLLGFIDKSGFNNYHLEFTSLPLPRNTYIERKESNIMVTRTVINDGTELGLTDLYPDQEDKCIHLNEFITPICEQTIILILTKNKLFENFVSAMRKQIERHNQGELENIDYQFNFILEYEYEEELVRHHFWDFDCDEFDVYIKFLSDSTPELILKEFKSVLYEDEMIYKNEGLKAFGPDIFRSIQLLEKSFLLNGNIPPELLVKYHCAIEDIYGIVLKQIKQQFNNLSKVSFKDTKTFHKFINIKMQPNKSFNISNIVDTLLFFIKTRSLKIEGVIPKDTLIKYEERLNSLLYIENYSSYRNKIAHSNLNPFNQDTLTVVINSYRKLIRFLIDFYSTIKWID